MSVTPDTRLAAPRTGIVASATPPETAAAAHLLAARRGSAADCRSSRLTSMMVKSGLGYARVRARRFVADFLGGAFEAVVADLMGRTDAVEGALACAA
jgi:hypothetical protein